MLAPALEMALERLASAGRCAVLSYHSGEDRIIKSVLRRAAGILPPLPGPPLPGSSQPVPPQLRCASCGMGSELLAEDEIASNRRASSARLRAVERLDERL